MGTTELTSNVFKTALLFEGGSLRACYTSAVAVWLLEQGVHFDNVYGVSAGSSNTVNYISRDLYRTKASFTTFIGDPKVAGWNHFLQHKGYFSAHYIYQESGRPDGSLPFDYETFIANPAKATIFAFDSVAGKDLVFRKDDLSSIEELMIRVRASSTLPIMMPAPIINSHKCYDGGFATGAGLPLLQILEDGFDRIVVVRTRPHGWRRPEGGQSWAKAVFWRHPEMCHAVMHRGSLYNVVVDQLEEMEAEGRVYQFTPDHLTVKGTERDVALLMRNYEAGYDQIKREGDALLRFIERGENVG